MTDPVHVEQHVAGLARVRDEELAGAESGTAARTLLASLLAGPAHRYQAEPPRRPAARRFRRLALAGAAVAAVTMASVLVPALLPDGIGQATSYANAAIEVTREVTRQGDFFVARIKDPLADRARYVEAFRAVGRDVDIELVPVSPALVGRLLEMRLDGPGRASTDLVSPAATTVDCAREPARCTLVIKVSADMTGRGHYKVGRAARPGETLQDPPGGVGGTPGEVGAGGGGVPGTPAPGG